MANHTATGPGRIPANLEPSTVERHDAWIAAKEVRRVLLA